MAMHTIDVDPETFRREIASWDGRDPTFAHIVLTAMTQCLLYGSGSILMAAIAGEFGVRLDDVRSWALGLSAPERPVQLRVVAAIDRHVRETVIIYLRHHERLPVAASATFETGQGKAAG